jgi:hypothetical protein
VVYTGNGRLYVYVTSRKKAQTSPIVLALNMFDALNFGDALISIAKSASLEKGRAVPKDGPGNVGSINSRTQEG